MRFAPSNTTIDTYITVLIHESPMNPINWKYSSPLNRKNYHLHPNTLYHQPYYSIHKSSQNICLQRNVGTSFAIHFTNATKEVI